MYVRLDGWMEGGREGGTDGRMDGRIMKSACMYCGGICVFFAHMSLQRPPGFYGSIWIWQISTHTSLRTAGRPAIG